MSIPLPRQKNLRADTAWVIYQILENGKSSRECLAKVQRRYQGKDNAWIQEMSLGVMRQLPLLQLWLRTLLDKPLKGKRKILEHLIMLGFYQIAFSRVSSHAAVSETVNAASYLGSMPLKGLVNAVLRNFDREGLATKPVDDPVIASGLPKWLYKRLVDAYPEQFQSVIDNTNLQAPVWLRVNTCQVSRETFEEALSETALTKPLSGILPR